MKPCIYYQPYCIPIEMGCIFWTAYYSATNDEEIRVVNVGLLTMVLLIFELHSSSLLETNMMHTEANNDM